MSRNERWNTRAEIKRRFGETTESGVKAGPVVFVENGHRYCDDGESHIEVIGNTGYGKSQCCSLAFMREVLQKGENLIMLDPKGEGYRLNACYIPAYYQVFCVDYRAPRTSPTKWNPLSTPYRLYSSSDPDETDIACAMLSELWEGVYPYDGVSDRFWTDSAVSYAKGLTYALFDIGTKDQINLDNIATMMDQSETMYGTSSLLQSLYNDVLSPMSLAKRCLATYVTGPRETRGAIHSVAAAGLEVFSRSRGLMEMLGQDSLNILDIDVDRPFALIVILPDENNQYDLLAGLLISQISQHLIRMAQRRGGKLSIRTNFILEKLGSVGRAIPTLPNLMVASRSRNMRLMLILQSYAQLIDVYGKSKAETINSCVGITFGFSTNSWETLTEWSHRCGERNIDIGGHIVKESLITPTQLAAMPRGTALILIDNQIKFISRLPFFAELYDNSTWRDPPAIPQKQHWMTKSLDFEKLIRQVKKRKMEEELQKASGDDHLHHGYSNGPYSDPEIDEMLTMINERLSIFDDEKDV